MSLTWEKCRHRTTGNPGPAMRATLPDRYFVLERDGIGGRWGPWYLEMGGPGLYDRQGFDDLVVAQSAAEQWATKQPKPTSK
jgi:hypothetical protein